MSEHLVIIPTFNEKENIRDIISAVFDLSETFHVLIVDDGSPDGTGAIVKEMQNEFGDKLSLIERSGKLGLGTAYIRGFYYGIENGYQFLYEMDADFSHDPNDLIRLREVLVNDASDVVVGSRYVKGGRLVNWPFGRIALSYGASLYVRLITGLPIKDPTAGFIAYKTKVLQDIDLDRIEAIGYAFQIEMKYSAWVKKYRLKEIPITFKDREKGTSKMSGDIIKEAAKSVLKIRNKK